MISAREIKVAIDLPESSQNNGNTSCPPWFVFNGTDCQCGSDLGGWVYCNQQTHVASLLNCHCMTYGNSTGVTVGESLYCCVTNSEYTVHGYFYIPKTISVLNEVMCEQFNRQGRLCGQCKEGFHSPVYSYDVHCRNCTYSRYDWVKYVTVAFGPLTVFFLTIITFSISPTNPPTLTAFVLTSQIISSPQVVRTLLGVTGSNANTLLHAYATIYGIWNLDFFRTLYPPICLPLTTLQVLALDYAIAFYPLVLIIVSWICIELHTRGFKPVIWLCRPFSKCFSLFRKQWNLKTSIIDAFAMFLLLSYVKVASVSFDLLLPATLYNVDGKILETRYLYYDASVEYFGEDHLPYAILALLSLLVINVFPLLLLLLYPCRCFQRCLTHLRVGSLALKIFMDAFQGCYKDGTAGTRDCRYFSAIYVGTRLLLLVIYTLTQTAIYTWSLLGMVFALISILCTIFRPYKSFMYNLIDSIMFFVIALWVFSIQAVAFGRLILPHSPLFSYILIYLLSTVPLCYITGAFFYWFIVKKKVPQKILDKLCIVNQTRIDEYRNLDFENTLPDRLVNPEEYENLLPDLAAENGYDSSSNGGSTTY